MYNPYISDNPLKLIYMDTFVLRDLPCRSVYLDTPFMPCSSTELVAGYGAATYSVFEAALDR
jgi:hypothetical protein